MWKQFTKSSSIGSSSSSFLFFFLFGWVGRRGRFIEGRCGVVWCGVDGTPHRLRSSVLAGRDNYIAVWNKVCTEADGSYTTESIEPSGRASKVPKETKNNDRPLSCWATAQSYYNYCISCMFLSGWLHEECFKRETEMSSSDLQQSYLKWISLTRNPKVGAMATYYTQCVLHLHESKDLAPYFGAPVGYTVAVLLFQF